MEDKKRTYKNIDDFLEQQKQALDKEHEVEVIEHNKIIEENSSIELEKIGLAINHLCLKSVKSGLYGRNLLCFTHPQYTNKSDMNAHFLNMVKLPETKISNGDNVSIHKSDQMLNSGQLLEGVVYRITDYKLVVSINDYEDFDPNKLDNIQLSIVMKVNEITHQRYMNALQEIRKTYENKKNPLINVLLNYENPDQINQNVKRELILNGPFQFYKKDLNQEQSDAIQFCLSREFVSLIHGPPGTGKTMTVCELIYQAVQKGMKVLACAGSNIAVDNIVERLAKTNIRVCRIGHPARMMPQVFEKCLDALIRKSSIFKDLKELKNNYNKNFKKLKKTVKISEKREIKSLLGALKKEQYDMEKLVIRETLTESQVICCTNAGAADKIFKNDLSKTIFDLVVIDECAQAVEISCWIPILRGRRLVLAGDHKQLPPTVKSNNHLLSLTLFDRILQDFHEFNLSKLLKVQYRMNTIIMNWSSNTVYNGQLQASNQVANHSINDIRGENNQEIKASIILFIDTNGAKMGENLQEKNQINENQKQTEENNLINDRNKSKSNLGEADLVFVIYKELKLHGLEDKEIGVITPYNAQVDIIRKLFEKNQIDRKNLEVSTVDGFQGREKECIIISLVRSNPLKQVGFLSDYRRMNVAITRARRFVCLIGDSETISSDKFLKDMYEYFVKFGEVRNALEYMGQDDVRFNEGFIDRNQLQNNVAKKQDSKEKQEKIKKQKKNKQKEKQIDQKEEQEEQKIDIEENFKQIEQIQQKQQQLETQIEENKSENKKQKINEDKIKLQELKQKYEEIIQSFINSKEQQIIFSSLNPQDNQIIHDVAEKMKLEHQTKGKGANKKIIVSKIQKEKTIKIQEKKVEKKNSDDDLDEDAFLEKEAAKNKYCWFKDEHKKNCKTLVELLGSNCHFCTGRFCIRHALAETHGCGEAASNDAKYRFRQQQQNEIAGTKKMKTGEEEYLRRKLQEKLDKAKDERKAKLPENKKQKK